MATAAASRRPVRGRRSTLRLYNFDGLRMPRVWLWGPKWKRSFDVKTVRYGDADVLVYSFEDDLREMMLDEIRPGVHAEWSDPKEWLSRTIASLADRSRDGDRSSRLTGRSGRTAAR